MAIEEENKIDSGEAAPELTPMTEDELVAAMQEEIANGIGGTNSPDQDVTLAMDYYLGRLPGITKRTAKDPNSSRYVSMDVMDGTEATVAEIMPMFSTDDIAFFEPSGQGDEDQAALESELINYLLFEQYDGWTLLQSATKDILLHRNCTVKAYWDERAEVTYDTYANVPPMALPQILQPTEEGQQVEVISQEATNSPSLEQADEGQTGQSAMANPVNPAQPETFTIKVRRTTLVGKPVIDSVAPENRIVNGDHDSPDLYDARFVAHESAQSVSALVQQGFDPALIAKIPDWSEGQESMSRARTGAEVNAVSAHKSTRLKQVYECYPLIDFDGDGIAERRKVVIGGNGTLLSNDEWTSVPLIGGVGMVVPHQYQGISLFDRLREIQDTKTPLVRSMVDGTQLASNPRLGVLTGEANFDDVMMSRTGGMVRMNRPDAVFPLAPAEVPASAYTLLGFMDEQRKERGGGAIGAANSAGKAQGQGGDFSLDRIMTSMELTNAVIAKSIGETLVRGIFVQLHQIIRENMRGELEAQIGGRWVKSAPSKWQTRANVSVQVGSSHAERMRQSAAMEKIISVQAQLQAAGSVMFSEQKAYTAITEGIKLSGIKGPERYIVDPSSPEGKKASEAQAKQSSEAKQKDLETQMAIVKAQVDMAKAEQMKGQAALQSQRVKAQNDQLQAEIDILKTKIDAADKSDKTQFDYVKLESDAALKLTELEAEYALELSKMNEANKGA